MQIGVPSGIGDFSWMWSKLCHVKEEISGIQIADGWPYRTLEYVQLCGVENVRYAPFDYHQILIGQQVHKLHTWEGIRQAGFNCVLLEANRHLEGGSTLETWLPDLPVNYHYPLLEKVPQQAIERARVLLSEVPKPRIGISCASYRGSEAWKTWGRGEWIEFLSRVMDWGWHPILLGGFWDDLTSHVARVLGLPDLVGRTDTNEMVAVLDQLEAYLGFSSGLGVIRTVLNRPAMMLWPEHQKLLATSWAPPRMVENHRYYPIQWLPVHEALRETACFLQICDMEMIDAQSDGKEASTSGR